MARFFWLFLAFYGLFPLSAQEPIFDYSRARNAPGDGAAGPVFDQLVWSDEFEEDGPVGGAKWHHQTLLPNGVSWFNGELQHYTDRIENSYVEDGHLYIMARRELFTDQGQTKEYTSARLNSKFAFTYGRVEVRAKLPTGAGTWPAIWMLGKNISEPGGYWYDEFGTTAWPACGEIDIMEHWGTNQNYVSSALHTPCSFGATVNVGGTFPGEVSNTFHIYAVEWYEDRMEFSIDGNIHYIYAPDIRNDCTWPFDADQYILLNVAMIPNVDPAFTESPMVIDYVRVYQSGATSASELNEENELRLFPNPSSGAFSLMLGRTVARFDVRVTDVTGKQVYSSTHRNRSMVDFNLDLPPGIYYVSVYSREGARRKKMMIN